MKKARVFFSVLQTEQGQSLYELRMPTLRLSASPSRSLPRYESFVSKVAKHQCRSVDQPADLGPCRTMEKVGAFFQHAS